MSQGEDELLPSLVAWMFGVQPKLPPAPLPGKRLELLTTSVGAVQLLNSFDPCSLKAPGFGFNP